MNSSKYLRSLLLEDKDDHNHDDNNDDYENYWNRVSAYVDDGLVERTTMEDDLQTRSKHHHFFRFRLRAFSIAPDISWFALLTSCVTCSPFCSICVTAGSCWTTMASSSSNNRASSMTCASSFCIASCLLVTCCKTLWDCPRRSLLSS